MWTMLCERGRDLARRMARRARRRRDRRRALGGRATRSPSPAARCTTSSTRFTFRDGRIARHATRSTCGAGAAWRSAPRARCWAGRRSCARRSSAQARRGLDAWIASHPRAAWRDEVPAQGSAWPTRLNRRSRTTACRASASCWSTSARPIAPTPSAVRRYLAQFLSDPRVIEIPPWLWKPILYGVILLVRPAQSAKKYAAIWTKDGSPLLVHSVRQRSLLLGYLGQRLKSAGFPADLCPVELGMRYGNPSVGAALDRLRAANCERILVAAAVSAIRGQHDGVGVRRGGRAPAPIAAHARPALRRHVPCRSRLHQGARAERQRLLGQARPPGPASCFRSTACRGGRWIAATRIIALPGDRHACSRGNWVWTSGQWTLAFQSRFGRAQWLKPYTAEVLQALAARACKRVDVFCPGFVADCLETLEEIGIEARATFMAGGRQGIQRDPLPQRASAVDCGAGGSRVPRTRWLAGASRRTPRPARRPSCAPRRWAQKPDAGPAHARRGPNNNPLFLSNFPVDVRGRGLNRAD